jgi:hypothetical protein
MKTFLIRSMNVAAIVSLFTFTAIAQDQTGEDPVWSQIKIDPDYIPQPVELIDYIPSTEPRYFQFGETDVLVGPNFRPHPTTNTTQSEMSVDVHPFNPLIVFGSANATNWPVTTIYGTGVYWTFDGGNNWTGYDDPLPIFPRNSGDPASVIGNNGYMYEGYISSSGGNGISVSSNGGANWSTFTVAPNPGSLADKNHLMVDKQVGSPYEHRLYATWTDFGGTNSYRVVVRYSTDFGQTWSSPSTNISSALGGYLHQGVNIQTGPNGEVYAAFAVYIDNSVSTGEDGIGFTKSTDGGVTWSAPTYAYQATNFGIRGTFSHKASIRVSSFPSMAVDRSGGPNHGYIYMTWPQRGVAPAGSDPDIVMIRSTDGGTTWSSPVRVNDDPLNNGKDQYFPWMTVDQTNGHLHFVWYDSRETTNDSAGVYMAFSIDGGLSFENYKVSEQNFRPKPISGLAGGYQGDYIGIAALSTLVYPFWCDDRTGNYQGWMSVVNFGTPDTIPPDPIIDLAVSDPTSSSLRLTWTVPNDTTPSGVTGYDIRYSTSPINNMTDFLNAVPVTFTGQPDTIGATESIVVEGLDFSTTYYFRIISRDMWSNWSELSNQASGTTFGAPTASVNPASVNVVLMNNSTTTETVTLSNISAGNSTLDYQVTLENNTFPDGMVEWKAIPLSTPVENTDKENPSENYGQSFRGSGGPDEFGYEWIDSNEPNGPEYVWEDIVSTGTQVTNWIPTGTWDPRDEGYAGPFPLGFTFKFYGIEKTEIYVAANGFLHFAPLTANTITNASIPNTAHPNDYIAPFWDDLDGRTQGTVHYKQDGNRFIMQFTNWQKYSGSGSLTFQVVLFSSGKIMYYYNNMVGTLTSATVGIENGNGTIGLQVAYNSAYVENNLAVKISAEPDWLGADPIIGRLYNGNSVDIELTFVTEDFPLGDYSMDMVVSSNDPVNPTITVPVTMSIVIPVELSSLRAETIRNSVNLFWTTASETNNQGFEIERKVGSLQSAVSNQGWEKAGYVEGKGSTTESQSYSYTDNNLSVGKYIYRLKQVDYDGTYEYSSEIEVDVLPPQEYALMQNYPNPFNPATTIEYTLPEKADVRIDVYSVLGELVTTLVNNTMEAGYQKISFSTGSFGDGSSLPSGTYIYRINAKGQSKNFVESKKMLLVK